MKQGQNFVKYFVRIWAMEFQEKMLMGFIDLYVFHTYLVPKAP